MSIASELTNLEGNIEDSYDAVNDMGGVIPAQRNMDNLDQAIRTIPQNTGTTYTAGTGIDITSDVISVDNTTVPFFTDLATVATTGDYGDLLNTPTIPAAQVNSDWDANSGVAQILNKPTIPTVNDATLTITQNGTDVQTFTANQSSNATANIETTYSSFIGNSPAATNQWRHIGTLTFANHQQGKMVWIRMLIGLSNNGTDNQCAYIDLIGQLGWTGSLSGRAGWSSVFCTMNTGAALARAVPKVIATSSTVYEIWLKASNQYTAVTGVFIPGFDANGVINAQWAPDHTSSWTSTEPSGTACNISTQRIIPTS